MDRLEADLAGRADVVRVDVMTRVGGALAERYGVQAVPTLLALDEAGQVIYSQAGLPDRAAIEAALGP